MAELPELWTEKTPEPRPSSDVVPAPGPASGVDLLALEVLPADPPSELEGRRERGPFLTYLAMPWSYSDREPGERWHRWRCRWGRHDMHGGHTMQLDGSFVFIERRCRWCDAGAAEVTPA